MSNQENCGLCQVPHDVHGTCCGWSNASTKVDEDFIIIDERHPDFGKKLGMQAGHFVTNVDLITGRCTICNKDLSNERTMFPRNCTPENNCINLPVNLSSNSDEIALPNRVNELETFLKELLEDECMPDWIAIKIDKALNKGGNHEA